MVSSQEKVHYVLAVAAGGIPVFLLPAPHYQSATKLACKLETNRLNNAFPIFLLSQITCNPFCIWFTFATGEVL